MLKLIASFSVIYLVLLAIKRHLYPVAVAGCLAVVVVSVWLIPDNARFWQVINGVDAADRFIFHENESSLSVIKLAPDRQSGIIFVNGLGQSGMPYRHDEVHTLLGALPVMIHPNPKRVAVIGLGSAGTVNGIGGRPETQRIDCFEIATNQGIVLADYARRTRETGGAGGDERPPPAPPVSRRPLRDSQQC